MSSRLLDERGIHHGADKKKDVETEKGHSALKKAVPGEQDNKSEHRSEHRSTEEHKGLGEKIKGGLSPFPSPWKVVANECCRETPSGTSLGYYPLESKKKYSFNHVLLLLLFWRFPGLLGTCMSSYLTKQ